MNILMFGPNGSGKGTQGALIKKAFGLAHIESGAIFREHVGGGTELGKKAKEYMDRGELVPDAITIPMVLETLNSKGANGWLLDGFPRNIAQAEQLHKAMQEQGMKLDYVVEIDLPRNIARDRIMGRRVCKNDGNHPNNIFIDAIKPNGDVCRVCGGELTARADDQDEAAINKRHDIYYDTKTGTLTAAHAFNALAKNRNETVVRLSTQGERGVAPRPGKTPLSIPLSAKPHGQFEMSRSLFHTLPNDLKAVFPVKLHGPFVFRVDREFQRPTHLLSELEQPGTRSFPLMSGRDEQCRKKILHQSHEAGDFPRSLIRVHHDLAQGQIEGPHILHLAFPVALSDEGMRLKRRLQPQGHDSLRIFVSECPNHPILVPTGDCPTPLWTTRPCRGMLSNS